MQTKEKRETKEQNTENTENKKIKKREKISKKKCKKLQTSNFVRIFSDYFSNLPFIKHFNLLNFVKGNYYLTIHSCLIALVVLISLFNNSILHLIILLVVVSLDALSIVVLHGCPLTHMEKKYLGVSGMDFHHMLLKNAKISYHCDHVYERQVELLINVWSIIALKILVIIFLQTFRIEMVNFNYLFVS